MDDIELKAEIRVERKATVEWLRFGFDQRARGSSAWEATVGDILRYVADSIERGEHRKDLEYLRF